MKKISIVLFILLIIGVFSVITFYNKESTFKEENGYPTYQTYNYLPKEIYNSEEIQNDYALSTICFESEPTLSELEAEATDIAIISIISLDGGSIDLSFALGATYGKSVVNNVLKGTLNNGDVIEYIKTGGIFTEAEWNNNQPAESLKKREKLQRESGIYDEYQEKSKKTYYQFHAPNDPLVEDGKVYLAYLKYNNNLSKYEIIGGSLGFRELNIEKREEVSSKPFDLEKCQIKDNQTQEYQLLKEVFSLKISPRK